MLKDEKKFDAYKTSTNDIWAFGMLFAEAILQQPVLTVEKDEERFAFMRETKVPVSQSGDDVQMKIFVKTLANKTIAFKVYKADTIESVMNKIQGKEGIQKEETLNLVPYIAVLQIVRGSQPLNNPISIISSATNSDQFFTVSSN
ncbi:MAG: hypothetical protein EZS28_001885 [Streblomastix strix]|uniref:Ubiquitin-like domain-containing protein n=1 Tax=Streblomastix strix TaxID=222440 RepID=A0A5J4X6T9_9EUKA|nr:MAG: hypothetical protein EZS28_001885 [Streblomastix strix]